MPDNILNGSAMRALARLEEELPALRREIALMATEQARTNQKLVSVESAINTIPQKCPYRESIAICAETKKDVKDLSGKVDKNADEISEIHSDISGLKSADRAIGVANATFTSVLTVITNAIQAAMK